MDIILTGHEKLRNVVDGIYLSESLCHVEQDWQLMIGCIPSSKTVVTAQLQQYRFLSESVFDGIKILLCLLFTVGDSPNVFINRMHVSHKDYGHGLVWRLLALPLVLALTKFHIKILQLIAPPTYLTSNTIKMAPDGPQISSLSDNQLRNHHHSVVMATFDAGAIVMANLKLRASFMFDHIFSLTDALFSFFVYSWNPR